MCPSDRIEAIAKVLWEPIPRPAQRQPKKPPQSWRQLKVGQLLRSLRPVTAGSVSYSPETLWEVNQVTPAGVKCITGAGPGTLWIMNPDWKPYYERARRPKGTTK